MHVVGYTYTHGLQNAHTASVSCVVFRAFAFGSSALLKNGISKDFLPTVFRIYIL